MKEVHVFMDRIEYEGKIILLEKPLQTRFDLWNFLYDEIHPREYKSIWHDMKICML